MQWAQTIGEGAMNAEKMTRAVREAIAFSVDEARRDGAPELLP